MIRIQQLGELTEYVFHAFETTGAYHIYPCFVLVGGEPIRTGSFGSPPSNGRMNSFGDKSCHHNNLKGELSILPYKTTKDEQSPVSFTSYIGETKVESQVSASHILMWGVGGQIPMRISSAVLAAISQGSRDALLRKRLFVSYPYPDTVLVTLDDPPWSRTKGRVSYELTTIGRDSNGKRCVVGSSQYFYYTGSFSNAPKCTLTPATSFKKGSNSTYIKNSSPSVTLDNKDLAHIVGFLDHIIPGQQSKDVWGELSYKAANQAKALDINTIAYLHDLLTIKETTMSTIQMLKGKLSLKKFANLELSYKYGLRQTYSDTKAVLKSLHRTLRSFQGAAIVRAQTSTVWSGPVPGSSVSVSGTTRNNLKCYYDAADAGITGALRQAMSADIFPSLENAWDLVPLSFVLDWFVDVSSLLDRIDSNTLISTLSVLSVIQTTRSSFSIDAQLVPRLRKRGLQGQLTYVRYDRLLTNHLTPPLPRFDEKQEFHNFVELGAIIVQKAR